MREEQLSVAHPVCMLQGWVLYHIGRKTSSETEARKLLKANNQPFFECPGDPVQKLKRRHPSIVRILKS